MNPVSLTNTVLRNTVAVAGHVCADLAPALTEATEILPGQLIEIGPLAISPGGCVSNTGVALAELGVAVRAYASIGDDELGAMVRTLLRDRGLDGAGLHVEPGGTTSYSIVVEKPRSNRSFWHHVGANAVFDGTAVVLDGCDLLHVGYPPLLNALSANGGAALVDLLQRARSEGITTSIDLAVVDPDGPSGRVDWQAVFEAALPFTDVFSPSIDDVTSALRLDPDEASPEVLAEQLLTLGAGVVALSSGEKGMVLAAAGEERLAAGGRVLAPLAARWAGVRTSAPARALDRVVTTNGAGDAASAGLIHALLAGLDPDAALAHSANVAAARIQGEPIASCALQP